MTFPKMRLTVTVEYTANPTDYGTEVPGAMAGIDATQFAKSPELLSWFLERYPIELKVEPVLG